MLETPLFMLALNHLVFRNLLLLLFSLAFHASMAQSEKNTLSIEAGVVRLNEKQNHLTVHGVYFTNTYNLSFGVAYFRRIQNRPFHYGLTLGSLSLSRSLENLGLPFNNPEREELPTVSLYVKQNHLYALPSFAYRPRLGKKLSLNFQLGLGFYYQFYPKLESELTYKNPDHRTETRLFIAIDEKESRFGILSSAKVGANYRVGKRSSIAANFQLLRSIQMRNSVAIFPITTSLKVNHANYSVNHWAFLNGHSFTLSYAYVF